MEQFEQSMHADIEKASSQELARNLKCQYLNDRPPTFSPIPIEPSLHQRRDLV